MVLWIVLAVVLLSLVYLGLVVRTLLQRLVRLRGQEAGLRRAAETAQELATVAQGLAAQAESVQVRTELMQSRLASIKEHRSAGRAA